MEKPDRKRSKLFVQYLICGTLIFLFSLWSDLGLPADTTPDTENYVAVARSFYSTGAQDRPPGYPFLIRLSMALGGVEWQRVILIIQCLMLSIVALIFMNVSQCIFGFRWTGILSAFVIGFAPSMIHWANVILAEMFLCFLLTLMWFILLHVLNIGDRITRKDFGAAVAVGFLSGFAALVKPVWVFGFLSLFIGITLATYKRIKSGILLASGIAIIHLIVILPWQIFLIKHFDQKFISRTGSINMNLFTIRAGLTKYCAGTPLYAYMEQKGLVDEAISLQWDDYAKFTQIKDSIKWEARNDESFYRAAFFRDPVTYLHLLLKRWHKFFTQSPAAVGEKNFPRMPGAVRYFYEGSYAWLFRRFVPFLLIATLLLAFKSPKLRPMILLSFSILFYQSLLVTLTSYQDPLLARMRVSVEPIMLFVTILPVLWLGSSWLTKKIQPDSKSTEEALST